jgi:hypothetical protein
MAHPSTTPAVNPSPYNLAINGVHDAIFSARQELHAIENELAFYAATAMSCLAYLPASDVPTDDEVARVRELERLVQGIAVTSGYIYTTACPPASEAFTAIAVEGLAAREKRIGVQRTAPVQFIERYMSVFPEDDNPDEALS